MKRRVKRSKPPPILGAVKYDPKEEIYLFGCLKLIIAHNLSQLMAISFMSGYIDVNIFMRWGLFGTFQTGNTCFLAMVFFPRGSDAWEFTNSPGLLLASIFIGSVAASILNCFCLEFTDSRDICFSIFSTITCILCGIDGFYTGPDNEHGASDANPFMLMPLLLFLNAMVCWSNATGYLTNLMTGNLMKLGKSVYLAFRSYSQGGAKARGDSVTLLLLFISFFCGVILSVRYHGTFYRQGFTLLPMAFMWPIFILVSGVLPEDYHITPYLKRMVAVEVALESNETGIAENPKSAKGVSLKGNSVISGGRSQKNRNSVFAIRPLANDDAKAEKEMYLNRILADTNMAEASMKFTIRETESSVNSQYVGSSHGGNNDAAISDLDEL